MIHIKGFKFFENWTSTTTWGGDIDPEEDIQNYIN